jgi:hypothetical protein
MSATRQREQAWWGDDDAPTQTLPYRVARGPATARGAATEPFRTPRREREVPRLIRPPRRGEPAEAARDDERRQSLWELAGLPDPSKLLTSALAIGILAVLLYLGLTGLLDWTRVKLDDMQYGRPRTSQLDAFVGHNEAGGVPTHFVALNLNRRVTIVEFPGGDVSQPRVIAGPYLFGRAEDLTVVKLRVEELNGDEAPDLIVQVKDERLVYLNEDGAFRPVTAEELAQLQAKEREGRR